MARAGAEWGRTCRHVRLRRATTDLVFDFSLRKRKSVLAVSSCTEALQPGGVSVLCARHSDLSHLGLLAGDGISDRDGYGDRDGGEDEN